MMLREEEEIEVFADKEGENDMQFLVMKMLRTKKVNLTFAVSAVNKHDSGF